MLPSWSPSKKELKGEIIVSDQSTVILMVFYVRPKSMHQFLLFLDTINLFEVKFFNI
jgi:hypothetical protein